MFSPKTGKKCSKLNVAGDIHGSFNRKFMVFPGTTLLKLHVFLRWANHPHDMPSWIFQKFCTLWCHSFSAYFHETIEFRQSFLTLFFLLTMPSLNSCCLEKFSRLFVLIHDGILGFMYQVGLFTILLRLQVWENSSNEGSIIWMFWLPVTMKFAYFVFLTICRDPWVY